jgi:hypothetical protein
MRLSISALICMGLLACGSPPTPVAPPAAPPEPPTTPPVPTQELIQVSRTEGPVPWTHLEARASKEHFQFAIVSDRTGGMRAGVFASAIPKLNLLGPELVMSVGDLIPGYTDDRARIQREWDEFDALVRHLQAPFFYVPGNHDLTNEAMNDVWHARYGPTHYAFVYRNVLFVCLNTMDGGLHQVQDQQLSWLRQVLADNGDVTWTLLFMHTPLWDRFEGREGQDRNIAPWKQVEAVLADRRYTAFAGHHHRYIKHERHDHKLFTLATTGGVSSRRGPQYGEFDQIMWVTMTPDGPVVANLLLDGIVNENARTPELRALLVGLTKDFTPTSIYYDGRFRRGASTLRVRNPHHAPLRVRLTTRPPPGLEVNPPSFEVTVPPGSSIEQILEVRARAQVETAVAIPVEWQARTARRRGDALEFAGQSSIGLVKLFHASPAKASIRIDGLLDEWGRLPIAVVHPRQVLGDRTALRGQSDSSFRAAVQYDDQFAYLAVEVTDDSISAERDTEPWEQDGIEVRLDARPDPVRAHSGGNRDGRDFLFLAVSPSASAADDWVVGWAYERFPRSTEVACVRTENGYVLEASIPRAAFDEALGTRASDIRINFAVNDQDADGQSQSWWWPDWRTEQDIPGSGTVRLGR